MSLSIKQQARVSNVSLTDAEKAAVTASGGDLNKALEAKRQRLLSSMEKANVIRSEFDVRSGKKAGVVSVYGLGQRFPVSLRLDQWEILSQNMPKILEFAKANTPSDK